MILIWCAAVLQRKGQHTSTTETIKAIINHLRSWIKNIVHCFSVGMRRKINEKKQDHKVHSRGSIRLKTYRKIFVGIVVIVWETRFYFRLVMANLNLLLQARRIISTSISKCVMPIFCNHVLI